MFGGWMIRLTREMSDNLIAGLLVAALAIMCYSVGVAVGYWWGKSKMYFTGDENEDEWEL
jgi:hypothetical protein